VIVQLDEARKRRERELRKLDPKRQALVKHMASQHPEWGPEGLEEGHQELESWGE
jgi:hypothetical protein